MFFENYWNNSQKKEKTGLEIKREREDADRKAAEELADSFRIPGSGRDTKIFVSPKIKPKVFIRPTAYQDMRMIVSKQDTEVAWYATVSTLGNYKYLIEEVFVPSQTAHSTTCEVTVSGMSEFVEYLLERPDGADQVNKIRMHGHSHVNMACSPSGEDSRWIELFRKDVEDFFISAILNKKGESRWDIFLFKEGIDFHDVPVYLYTENDYVERAAEWGRILSDKVKSHRETQGSVYVGSGGGSGSPTWVFRDEVNPRPIGNILERRTASEINDLLMMARKS